MNCDFARSLLPFALLSGLASASVPAPVPRPLPDCAFQAPPYQPLGATDIDVFPTGYQVVGGPFVTSTSGYPLIDAIEAAEAVYATKQDIVVLDVHGAIPAGQGMQIGGGDAGLKAYRAEWVNDPIDVAIRGVSGYPNDQIRSFAVMKNLNNGTPTPGVKRFRVESLRILPQSFANAVVSTPKGSQEPSLPGGGYARIQIYGCEFLRGTGNPKWGARLHGRCRFDFRANHFEYMHEHCLYADSPQGNSFFMHNTMEGSTRTMVQIVNRSNDNPGPSGFGYLLIEGNTATNIDLDGGSDFTVAGHLGVVILRDNHSTTNGIQAGQQGSIVVWSDENPAHGIYTNPNGFTTNKVIIQDHGVNHPNADRDHVQISGAEVVEIRGSFLIVGNRTAFVFDSLFGGSIPNGSECFFQPQPVSQYGGFQSATKVKRGNTPLTNPQIDALFCSSPVCP